MGSGNIFAGFASTNGAMAIRSAGFIREFGSDAGVDLSTGTNLYLNATTGIGTADNPIEVRAADLTQSTTTGTIHTVLLP